MTARYFANGLSIAADMPLPDFAPHPDDGEPDLRIILGPVSEWLDIPFRADRQMQFGDGVFQVNKEGVARYRVSHGREIRIQPCPGVSFDVVRSWLVGPVFGILMHQRGDLPLHAASFEVDGAAIALCGASGSGKSTLTVALSRAGFGVLSDDITVVRSRGDGPFEAFAGARLAKLWSESATHFGVETTMVDGRREQKLLLRLPAEAPAQSRPLAALYFLADGEGRAAVAPVSRARVAAHLIANIYRVGLLRMVADPRPVFDACAALAASTPAYMLRRPWELERIEESVAAIAAHQARRAREINLAEAV